MAWQNHLYVHLFSTLHNRVEVLHLKPKQHAVAVRFIGTIPDSTVLMLGLKAVQLKDELSILHQLLVVAATMRPATSEQSLIPPAAGFDIRDTDERLRAHGSQANRKDMELSIRPCGRN